MTETLAPIDQNTLRRRGLGLRALNPAKAFSGYTLFAPLMGQGAVYLIDMGGRALHRWQLPYPPGLYGYLLPNGNLFYNAKTPAAHLHYPRWPMHKGGKLLEVDPAGQILWECEHPDHHHDGRRMRNGNALLLCLERIPQELVPRVKGGLPGTEHEGHIHADVIHEVTPAGETIWSWHAHEHLDPETEVITPQDARNEWTHGNTVAEMADGNILVSFRSISTVVVVDKKTGEIIWKLGADVLAQQHDPCELPNGNILIFDNGTDRPHPNAPITYSRVIEVDRRTRQVVWEYRDDPPFAFYSPHISGAQRLPNGNTLITEGAFGRLFEVTRDGEVVWEYINPYFGLAPGATPVLPGRGEQNAVFRAFRYAPAEVPWLNAR